MKTGFHPRNPHRHRYDFEALAEANPVLKKFILPTIKGEKSIDFTSSEAVIELNRSLLMHHYGIKKWSIPKGYLCPPIPSRADYIHHLADLISEDFPKEQRHRIVGASVRVLDIGTGANCIYPLLGHAAYKWSFVGSETDKGALKSAKEILKNNSDFSQAIQLRFQQNPERIFNGIFNKDEHFNAVICNPPYQDSIAGAEKATEQKWKKLGVQKSSDDRNFGGQANELWYEGGEQAFLKNMVRESKGFAQQVGWFTTLVSKKERVFGLKRALKKAKAKDMRVIEMQHGQKKSRIVAWRF